MTEALRTAQIGPDTVRSLYKAGDYPAVIDMAKQLVGEHPNSAATLILRGDSEMELGRFSDAHVSYLRALSVYRNRFSEVTADLSTDIAATERRLIEVEIVLGLYKDARTRTLRLARGGDVSYKKIAERPYNQTKDEARRSLALGRYEEARRLASEYLMKKGEEDPEMEIILANSLVMQGDNTSLKDLMASYLIARRVSFAYPDMPQALNVLGLVGEIATSLCKKGQLKEKSAQRLLVPDLQIISYYRRALELDPQNQVARERYKALTGKDFQEGRLGAWFKTGYLPPSYLSVSPRLKKDSQASFDENEEVSWYWNLHRREYHQFIDDLDAQIGEAMDPRCRVAVCIPAFMEKDNIYRTLLEYTKQEGVSPEEFEIIVLENHPDDPKYSRDHTAAEIARFRQDYPNLKVYHVYHRFPNEAKAMGNIRKTVFDLAIRRGMKRAQREGELILASNDADFYGMKPRSLRFIIDSFDTRPELDLLAGKWDYPKEALLRFPTVHALIRFVRYYHDLQERYYGQSRVISSGACSYFRSSVYAAIGGYAYKVKRGSDSEIGLRIAYHRGNTAYRRLEATNALRLFTDPRRSLSKMVVGKHWVDQWEDQDWQEDPRVRGKTWREFGDPTLTSFCRERLEEEINAFLKRKLDAIAAKPRSRTALREIYLIGRAFDFLGVDCQIVDGKVRLIDTQVLEKGLAEYAREEAS